MFTRKPKVITSVGHFDTLISAATTIDGPVSFAGTIKVEGEINGEVRAVPIKKDGGSNTVFIEAGGSIVGDVTADAVIVNGTVHGNIVAKSVSIGPKGVVCGPYKIKYTLIQIAPGALISSMLDGTGEDLETIVESIISLQAPTKEIQHTIK